MKDDDIKNTDPEDEDILLEDTEEIQGEESLQETIKKLRKKLKLAEQEKQEYLQGWQRAKADYINSRKKDEDQNNEFVKFANANFIKELVPVLQSFEMAFSNRENWEKIDSNWRKGVEYIYSQLSSVLSNHGVVAINPVGVAFDPSKHEALGVVPTDKPEDDGKVLEVIQKGYELNGKLLKTATVKIGKLKDNQ